MILVISSLNAGYDDLTVLRDVSLGVERGNIVALLGANGAGKTTLLNAVSGLVTQVHSGDIFLEGVKITHMPAHERVELGIAHVPQGRHLFPFMSVRDNLELGTYTDQAHKRRQNNLDFILHIFPRLKERLGQIAGSLSGGEQQMCAIGRGLMSDPKYLLLDEPSLGLAPIIVKQVMAVLGTVAQRNIGILLVEQNVTLALKVAQTAHVLEHSKIVITGLAQDLANDDRIRKAYLGL